jgi:electron transfer flavoprotein alpha/beta subunit
LQIADCRLRRCTASLAIGDSRFAKLNMSNNLLIIAEGRAEGLKKVSLELVNVAQQLAAALGGATEGAVVGSNVGAWADTLAKTGVAKVYVADNPGLAHFAPESYTTALAEIIAQAQPAIVLFGATGWGKEVSARVAAKLDWGLATDCTAAQIENGTLVLTRPIYAGKAIAHVQANRFPVMVSIRPNIIPPVEANQAAAPIETVAVTLKEPRARVVETVAKQKSKVDLGEASIVVSGGRGVKWARRARQWTRAGLITPIRSDKPARPFRRNCTSPPASAAQFNISRACPPAKSLSRLTKTPTRRFSKSPITASSVICSTCCPH